MKKIFNFLKDLVDELPMIFILLFDKEAHRQLDYDNGGGEVEE